jgi:hypothetical protein
MLAVSALSLVLAGQTPAPVSWLKDYDQATRQSVKEKKDLFILFQERGDLDEVVRHPEVARALKRFVCLRLSVAYQYRGNKLLDYPALEDMMGKPGIAIISMHNVKLATHWQVISAHPLVGSRYRWVPEYGVEEVKIILGLPARASLSQRSMIYAVRVHPEQPQSVYAECHSAFLDHAERHSRRQASMQNQHHANLAAASSQLQSETGVGFGGASEVVAESWGRFVGGENVLEASFSCIDAWRHSGGHWSSVAGQHRFFGYDIAQGNNGTWYATGIFAR